MEDPFSEDKKRILLLSVSSDGDLRAWSFNPDNVSTTLESIDKEVKTLSKIAVKNKIKDDLLNDY